MHISPEKEEVLKAKARRISIKEGAAASLMDSFGTRYITPFALAMGSNNTIIGILASLPNLLGNFSQMLTIKIMEQASRKKILVTGTLLQAIMWLPLILIGLLFSLSHSVLHFDAVVMGLFIMVVYSLGFAFGSAITPAWISWMKDIVEGHRLGVYFGKRERIIVIIGLIGMLIAGIALDFFKKINLFLGFSVLFGVAFFVRVLSSHLLTKQYEPKFQQKKESFFDIWQFIKKMSHNNFGRFVIFISAFYFGVYVAGPFFSVYMLKDLNFTYTQYIIIVMASLLSHIIFVPAWGKFSDTYGNLIVLRITGVAIPAIPLLWLLSPIVLLYQPSMLLFYLIAIEAFSGMMWAGFNLSSSNFVYDAVTRDKLAICASYLNIIKAVAIFIGATLGGLLSTYSFGILGLAPLLSIFLLSGILRIATLGFFLHRIREVRFVREFGVKQALEKFSHMTPHKLFNYVFR